MIHYDYRLVPAPRKMKRVKGVSDPDELFAITLTDTINEVARQGWEYVRAERLPSEAPRGWLRAAIFEERVLLVFRRQRESLSPRLASAQETAGLDLPPEPSPPQPIAPLERGPERAAVDRLKARFRRAEPSLGGDPIDDGRQLPRLGPADQG